MKKFSEMVGTNWFELPTWIPGKKLMYYLDYKVQGRGSSINIFQKRKLKILPKEVIQMDQEYVLVGVLIKASDEDKFQKCMKELERTAELLGINYHEAKTAILDDIVVMK